MGRTILYTAVSLDGYIADINGKIDFLDHPRFDLPDEDYGYEAFMEGIDTIVMGYNTNAQILQFEGGYPYKGKHSIVLSRDANIPLADENVEVFTDGSVALLKALKEQGKRIWIVGGGATNARFHEADLIDELILTYIPAMLGNGIPLFRENEGQSEWKTESVRSYPNGLVQLHLVRS